MLDNNYSERERLVIDLYKNQNKSIRDIAKMAKMSFRDIGFILKKEGLSRGLAMTVTKHHTYLDKNNELELKPDIVISKRRSNIIMIIDTKYKILDERIQQQEDVSQILDYCLAEKAPIGLLVYPKFEEEIEKEYEIKHTDK